MILAQRLIQSPGTIYSLIIIQVYTFIILLSIAWVQIYHFFVTTLKTISFILLNNLDKIKIIIIIGIRS